MYKVLKKIEKEKPKEQIFLRENDEIISNENIINDKITKFFERFVNSNIINDISKTKPVQMKNPFKAEEIKEAVKKLKNNKSPGKDQITAEQIKNAPEILYRIIADMFNNVAKTGEYPKEIIEGLIIPIQKQGKKKGEIENLRPITLLNQIRKILSIVMISRIYSRIDNKINITQTAYRRGRSATENNFTFKIIAEKAISTSNEEVNVLLFDMSKAFDRVSRNMLIEDLKNIVDDDELHILNIMINEVQLQIKTKGKLG